MIFLNGVENYEYYEDIAKSIMKHVSYKDIDIVLCIISTESEFNKNAVSRKYKGDHADYGLMQISSYFWKFNKELIFDIEYNISYGYFIFNSFSDGHSYYSPLKAYNGSHEYAIKVLKKYNKLKNDFYEK